MRKMRSQRAANASSCVTRNRVAPTRPRNANNSSTMPAPVAPSRLPVGSSANSTSGSCTMARASAMRCCSPPESWLGIMLRALLKTHGFQRARALAERILAPRNSSGTAMFSSAVMVGIRWNDWNTMPTCARGSGRGHLRPCCQIGSGDGDRPDVAASNPAATIISDDLPEPDGPNSATASPLATSSETPFRMLTGPAALANVRRTSLSQIAAPFAWPLVWLEDAVTRCSMASRQASAEDLR